MLVSYSSAQSLALFHVVSRHHSCAYQVSVIDTFCQLDSRTRDEEPLVNTTVDGSRSIIGALRNLLELRMVDAVRRAVIGDIGQVDVATLLLARDQSLPGVTAFTDDLLGVLLVLAFTTESELVLRLAVGDLVDAEPLVRGSKEAR